MIRTTLVLEEACMKKLKRMAGEQNRTLTDLVGEILAEGIQLREQRVAVQPPKLPSHAMGVPKADLANRPAVEQALSS